MSAIWSDAVALDGLVGDGDVARAVEHLVVGGVDRRAFVGEVLQRRSKPSLELRRVGGGDLQALRGRGRRRVDRQRRGGRRRRRCPLRLEPDAELVGAALGGRLEAFDRLDVVAGDRVRGAERLPLRGRAAGSGRRRSASRRRRCCVQWTSALSSQRVALPADVQFLRRGGRRRVVGDRALRRRGPGSRPSPRARASGGRRRVGSGPGCRRLRSGWSPPTICSGTTTSSLALRIR